MYVHNIVHIIAIAVNHVDIVLSLCNYVVLYIFTGLVISVVTLALLRPSRPPHWAMLIVLVSLAFILSIVWLNIIANEVVGVLTSLGLLLNIKTGYHSWRVLFMNITSCAMIPCSSIPIRYRVMFYIYSCLKTIDLRNLQGFFNVYHEF